MNVGELKAKLAFLPDTAPVLVPRSDHSYGRADILATEATQWGNIRRPEYSEYFGPEDLQPEEKLVPALVIG